MKVVKIRKYSNISALQSTVKLKEKTIIVKCFTLYILYYITHWRYVNKFT